MVGMKKKIQQTRNVPLQSLVVANGGLGNGVSREELSAALKEMGQLETLVMQPHKPYAFVTYRCHLLPERSDL